ncbi:MAG: hypothetical protein KME15_17330 [Drouetiella hepatica Uher 2000/2452]|uniref:Uncharacterized protein n=1 Tax=Drouetiella hepatica Uher 2000/2452 TaxID=904376 RepID=A0A951QFK0_9CYAN|nr:hypothetical protein [Drouetiella hepatica Uher 2000/2452]
MAVATGRRPKAISVSKQAVDQAGALLGQLPEKPKENLSLRDAIDQLQEEIKEALSKGYTYIDVAGLLANKDILISPATLKRYVSMGRGRAAQARKDAAVKTPRRRKNAALTEMGSDAPADSSADSDSGQRKRRGAKVVETPVEEAPKAETKPTTGRRRSAAKPSTSTSTSGRGRKKSGT